MITRCQRNSGGSQSLINNNIRLDKIQDLFENSGSSDVVRFACDTETILSSRDPELVVTSLTYDVALEM